MKYEVKHTEKTLGSREAIWHLWSHVDSWKDWDTEIQWCQLDEGSTFTVGGKMRLLPKGSPAPVNAVITECVENTRFVDVGNTPLGSITLFHEMVENKEGLFVTHIMTFVPANAQTEEIFKNNLFKKLQHGIPESVRKLTKLAEKVQNVR